MTSTKALLAASAGALLASACATVPPPPAAPLAPQPAVAAAPAPASVSPSEQLRALFKQSDEDNLRRNPLNALFRGDMRYAEQLGDNITDAYYASERQAAEQELAALAAIDRSALSPTDRLAYDVFKRQQEISLRSLGAELLPLTAVRPIDHFFGFHTFYPDLASGQGAAPFKTVKD